MKVLVVDDSALMRRRIGEILTQGGFEVKTARDGEDALAQLPRFRPDVITLDIHMPGMDGIECLRRIMAEQPTPVVMISLMAKKDAPDTLEALQLGAVDFFEKPGAPASGDIASVAKQLLEKVRAAAHSRPRTRVHDRSHLASRPQLSEDEQASSLVLIGASTGGPSALEELLSGLSPDFPLPILVCQHMPATITPHFAQRLDQNCRLSVEEVRRTRPLLPGHVFIGRGDADLVVVRQLGRLSATSMPSDPRIAWHPSVGRLVQTAMRHVPASSLIGVMLTGMGDDGADEMAALHRAGGRTVAEAQESCVVFGMPHALITRGGAGRILPISRIGRQITIWAGELAEREPVPAGKLRS